MFYLRTQSAAATIVPARLWDPQPFHAYERGDYAAQAWYFGMVTAMIFFNLLLFASLRDSVYLLYISFATSMALALSIQNGLAKEFLWPDTTLWSDTSSNFSYLLTVMAFIFFTRNMLETAKKFPKIDLQLKILAGCCLFFLIGATVWTKTFAMPSTSFIFIVSISILGISLFCAFKRQRSAYFFVVAYTTFLLSALMTCLMFLGLIHISTLTIYGMQWASAMEMLLLAFALADRFIMIRRKAIDDVKQVNVNLEQRLQEREAELKTSHEQLREIGQRQMLSQERQRLMQDMHDGLGSSLISALRWWSMAGWMKPKLRKCSRAVSTI